MTDDRIDKTLIRIFGRDSCLKKRCIKVLRCSSHSSFLGSISEDKCDNNLSTEASYKYKKKL